MPVGTEIKISLPEMEEGKVSFHISEAAYRIECTVSVYTFDRKEGVTMNSIWTMTTETEERQPLKKNLSVDTAVIGGGIAGVLTAHFLKQSGIETVVLEADRLFGGQTKNTTAKITLQHGLIYHKLIEKVGKERAGLYVEANRAAIGQYRRMAEEENMDCFFRSCNACLYTMKDGEALQKEEAAARSLGICAEYTTKTELPFQVKGALCYYDQAVFHPLLFLKKIAEGLTVYENTRVVDVKGHELITEDYRVEAEHIVFATHYPFINIPGFYFLRMHQERSYVLALQNTRQMDNMYYGIDRDGLSFRKSGDVLLLGGGSHRTGENKGGGKYRDLRMAAEKMFPGCREVTRWSAQDCMPVDDIPYIGRYSAEYPDWYVATGFRKWGMTSAMAAAMLIRELITEGKSRFEEVFTPQRLNLQASAGKLAEEGMESAKGLGKGLFTATPRCPHMGCALEWNPDELSWDCPCHGSRFDSNGKLMDNPAQVDLEV